MRPERLTRRRFAALLNSRGPLLDAWPEAERNAALHLLARSAPSRHLLADRLAGEPAIPERPEEDADLAMRLRAVLWQRLPEPRPAKARRRIGMTGGAVRVGALAASFAASFALGAWLGLASVPIASSGSLELFASVQTGLIAPDLP